jgi:hypothetical protein
MAHDGALLMTEDGKGTFGAFHGIGLVGRDKVIAGIQAFPSDEARILCLHGTGGIGKNRVLTETGLLAQDQGFQVLWPLEATMLNAAVVLLHCSKDRIVNRRAKRPSVDLNSRGADAFTEFSNEELEGSYFHSISKGPGDACNRATAREAPLTPPKTDFSQLGQTRWDCPVY